ncbi:MAG: type I-C CRISPR-associated protein Cas7/Csd2, partial [Clostridia bacterium]|nr:type I-C CRISPR-associated protein Cas7/Csd2 [Clostridia bacterium]
SMKIIKVIWWEHNNKLGQYSSAKVHDSLTVDASGEVSLNELDGLKPEIFEG